jgi:4'-phosphopantetheinyl transferase
MATSSQPKPIIVQWLLDTRTLYPSATKTSDLATVASHALALLPPDDRAAVLRYVHPRDAKMSLASHLLKRYLIARYAAIPWDAATPTRDARTKPVFVSPAGHPVVAFNVSHQAGLVALVATVSPPGAAQVEVDVGVDVASPTERRARDTAMIAADGWPAFVDMHADVFSPLEAAYLKHAVLTTAPPPEVRRAGVLDYKLRAFYTLWCLREAYVKMTGEALLASWLGDLEFRGFSPPSPVAEGEQGEGVQEYEIWFKGQKVEDANVCLRPLGNDFLLCTAVRTPALKEVGLGLELRSFHWLGIDEIVTFAESQI